MTTSNVGAATDTYCAGHVLLWAVSANLCDSAYDLALAMGELADIHGHGEWGIAPIGLGETYWFDLVLRKDEEAIFLLLVYNREPDAVY